MTGIDSWTPRGLLFDMDGVWFVGEQAVEGAQEALAAVRSRGIPCRFVTNTTTKTIDDLWAKMSRLGLDVSRDELINSPRAAVIYLQARGEPSVHCIVSRNVQAEFDGFPRSDHPDFVVIGDIGEEWNYAVLNQAFRMLMGGAQLVAMHRGRYWQVDDGLALDIGAFVTGLEYASGQEAILVGKPSRTIFESALSSMGLGPEEVAMIGDDVHSDIGGAQACGIRGILVRTGKYRADLVGQSGVVPDAVIDSIADLPALL